MFSRTPKLLTLLLGAAFLFIVATFFRLNQLFFMCSVLVVLPVVSYAFASWSLRGVTCERRVPDRLTEGQEVEISLILSNRSWLPKFLLKVEDHLPEWLEVTEDTSPVCIIPVLLWGERFEHRYRVRARLRGLHRLGPAQATAIDAFDLFRAYYGLAGTSEILVYPRTVALMNDPFAGGRVLGFATQPRASASPDGIDFYSTREYQPGDDLRRIHWRTTARIGKFSVIEFEQSFSTHLALVLDVRAGIHVGRGPEATLEYAVRLAASLARYELQRGNAVGLFACGEEPLEIPLASGMQQFARILEALALVQDDGEVSLAEAVREYEREFGRGTTVALFSPLLSEEIVEAVSALRAQHLNVAYFFLDPVTFIAPETSAREQGRSRLGSQEAWKKATAAMLAALHGLGVAVYRLCQGDDLRYGREWSERHVRA